MFPTMAQKRPPPMKLYILNDTATAATGQKEKGASTVHSEESGLELRGMI